MLNFKKFNSRYENHQRLAEKGVDVIFYEDDNPIVRFGYLYEKEHNDCTRMDYRIYSKTIWEGELVEFDYDAQGLMFCVVNQDNY